MTEEPTQVQAAEQGSVRVVGTAHVSSESAEEVQRVIEAEDPDVVAVELDQGRYRQMKGEAPEDIDPKDLLQGSVAFQFLAYWMLSYVQKRLGDHFDVEPGADMKAGIDTAEAMNIDVALIDRDIQVTIQRFWARMRLREKLRLLWELVLAIIGIGGSADADEIDLESLTDTDVVSAMMEEFRRFSPNGAEALIDERDAYLAHNLIALRDSGADVVAVVGAGHQKGIEGFLADPTGLPPMESIVNREQKRFSLAKIAGYLLALGFITFFVLLAMAGVGNAVLLKVFVAWFLFNGIFAFALAKLGGAHWTSASVGGLVAWMTSINPLLAPGWFAGYVELRRRPVNIGDIGTLNEILSDEESPIRDLLRDMLNVPLFRLIAVVALTNVGSMIATFLFPVVVLPLLGGPFDSVASITTAMETGARNSAEAVLRLFI